MIPVEAAPAPVLSIPTYPTEMTCSEAESFVGQYASFTNGLSGDCENAGFVSPTIEKNIDACSGGTVTITYEGEDDCGNSLSSTPVVIIVLPASLPTIKIPQDGEPVYCWEAEGYLPENAIFSNEENGDCENQGELVATTVEHFWNTCDGGVIMIQYTGYDNCGNYLESDVLAKTVLPDTWAPTGECIEVEETMDDMKNIPGPSELDNYIIDMMASYSDYCGNIDYEIIGDTGMPECELDGTFARVYEIEISDDCGNAAEVCTITFSGICNPLYCTLSQQFYSSPDESFGGNTSTAIIENLIDSGNNPIEIGSGACGFVLDNTSCIQAALAGEGQSISLANTLNFSCEMRSIITWPIKSSRRF